MFFEAMFRRDIDIIKLFKNDSCIETLNKQCQIVQIHLIQKSCFYFQALFISEMVHGN